MLSFRAVQPSNPGSDLSNVFTLRTVDEGNLINSALTKESDVVIVGSSFIGKHQNSVKEVLRLLNVVGPSRQPNRPKGSLGHHNLKSIIPNLMQSHVILTSTIVTLLYKLN